MWTQFGIAMVTIIAMDALWLGWLMKDFYRRHLGHIARMADGGFDPIWPVAALVYPTLAGGITVLVLGRAKSAGEALALGAFFGLITYGVYDLTNHSILRGWPAVLTVTDMAWGTLLCGTAAWLAYVATRTA
jgi:uncharacterized membrane protein